MAQYEYYVYLMANKINTVIYTGVTNDIEGRVWEHKTKFNPKSFTSRYNVNKLVYYEEYDDIGEVIHREKQIKAGSRKKKIELIERENKKWEDLSKDWYE